MKKLILGFSVISTLLLSSAAEAAVTIDRTRVIFPGNSDSISLSVINSNKSLPYLAQAWLENSEGQKINSPFTILPPIQRLEASSRSLLKIQALPGIVQLPQDRESLFYFNLREIPPKAEKANTLQLALQTKVKFFYRPKALVMMSSGVSKPKPWQQQLVLQQENGRYRLQNPTPYYVTIASALKTGGSKADGKFEPIMLAPKTDEVLDLTVRQLGQDPVLTYIDDFGAQRKLHFI